MRNQEVAPNQAPKAPNGLRMERGTDHLVLRWEVGEGDDLTPPGTLTWNVRVVGAGVGGVGAVLNVSEDLVTWTPLLPFVRAGDRFEARDIRARASQGRFYQAR